MGKITLITGSDEYAVKNKTREIIVSICGENPEINTALETIIPDPEGRKQSLALAEARNTIQTPPFLSPDKIVWLKHFDYEKFKKAEGSNETAGEIFESFQDILKEGMPEETTLVMSIISLDKRSSFYNLCKKICGKEIYVYDKSSQNSRDSGANVQELIYDLCERRKIRISEDAKNFVVAACGGDSGRVVNEIEKLAAFVYPETNVGIQDCRAICSRTPEAAAWAFSTAVCEKNLPEALDSLKIMLDLKNKEISILYSLIRDFQLIGSVKAAAGRLGIPQGAPYPSFKARIEKAPEDIRDEFKDNPVFTSNPYRAWKLFESGAAFSDSELACALSDILKTNKSLVSGAVSPSLELELLAVKLCSTRRRPQKKSPVRA